MKIMFFIPGLGSGGAERVISILANSLAEKGIEIDIVSICNDKCVYNINTEINRINLDMDKFNGNKISKIIERLKRIRLITKNKKPDIIISFLSEVNIDVCFALLGIKTPIIVSERNDPKIDPKSKIKQILRKIAYMNASGYVFQTDDAQNYFSNKIKRKSKIIMNPLSENLPTVNFEEREKRIVSVGRLNNQKNYPMTFKAFQKFSKEYPEYTLEIYGEGNLKDDLTQLIKEMNLTEKIILKGFCSNVHKEVKNAAMFVMSSDFEGMPNALIEAMAMGIPSISTDCPCGGPKMLIKDKENGLLVPVGNSQLLLEAMKYYADFPSEARKTSEKSVLIKEKLNKAEIVNQWFNYIEEIIKK